MSLHPFIADLFAKMAQAGRPAISAGSPDDARALTRSSRAALGRGPELPQVEELLVPTRSGTINGRLYLPQAQPIGAIVYTHGGGWVVGELDDFDAMARTLAARSHCAVFMPDYRLAPEHPFPAGLEDVEDAIGWAATQSTRWCGGAVPLVVAGDSAGGNLTAVTVQALADKVQLAGQVLIYPVTDADFDRDSYLNFSRGMQLTREDMQWFFSHYAPTERHLDPRISPMRQAPRPDTPTTVVVTAECDVLRDEGEVYARQLEQAGIPTALRRIAGLPHGFIRMHNLVDTADAALSDIARDVQDMCRAATSTTRGQHG